jgi:hypothetical protein
MSDNDRIAGTATTTSGNIVAQEISQDITELLRKLPGARNG